jgi:hypothetical protein
VLVPHGLEVSAQGLASRLRKHRHAIAIAFAGANEELPTVEVHVLHAQSGAFEQA